MRRPVRDMIPTFGRHATRGGAGRGFTLFECMLAVSLLVGIVGAIAQIIVAGQMETADALHHAKGTSLVRAMMQEVLAQPYYGPNNTTPSGPTSGQTRSTYNCIGNYNGFTESAGHITDASGTAYTSDYQGFSVSVTCTYGNTLTLTGVSPALSGANICVTVSDGHGRSWVLNEFIPSSL